MQTQIINGNKIKDDILDSVREGVKSLSFVPLFCDVLVGDDKASIQYVQMKKKIAESVGISFKQASFPADIPEERLIQEIKELNNQENMCGIIVQLPLPSHFNTQEILNAIDPILDVDCLNEFSSNLFYNTDDDVLVYPTALSCVKILDSLPIDLLKLKVAMLGYGRLVGRPLSRLLKKRGVDVEYIVRDTQYKDRILKNADIVVSAIGSGKYLQGSMIKDGAIVIDAGTSEDNGCLVGDVDFISMQGVASYVSPTPGGVGPVTVAMLLSNVLKVAKSKDESTNI